MKDEIEETNSRGLDGNQSHGDDAVPDKVATLRKRRKATAEITDMVLSNAKPNAEPQEASSEETTVRGQKTDPKSRKVIRDDTTTIWTIASPVASWLRRKKARAIDTSCSEPCPSMEFACVGIQDAVYNLITKTNTSNNDEGQLRIDADTATAMFLVRFADEMEDIVGVFWRDVWDWKVSVMAWVLKELHYHGLLGANRRPGRVDWNRCAGTLLSENFSLLQSRVCFLHNTSRIGRCRWTMSKDGTEAFRTLEALTSLLVRTLDRRFDCPFHWERIKKKWRVRVDAMLKNMNKFARVVPSAVSISNVCSSIEAGTLVLQDGMETLILRQRQILYALATPKEPLTYYLRLRCSPREGNTLVINLDALDDRRVGGILSLPWGISTTSTPVADTSGTDVSNATVARTFPASRGKKTLDGLLAIWMRLLFFLIRGLPRGIWFLIKIGLGLFVLKLLYRFTIGQYFAA